MSAAATARKRRRKASKPSCSTLRKRARKIKNARKRKKALAKLPARCRPKPTKPKLPSLPSGTQPAVTMVAPPPSGTPAAPPAATVPGAPLPIDPTEVYTGEFGARQAERLMWRAGFGPKPGQAAAVAAMGLEAAVTALTRPTGNATLDGPAPSVDGDALDPYGSWGHDHLWWLDRMVRSSQPLVERMALVFHDWFATSNEGVGNTQLMMTQTNVFRQFGLGRFDDLLLAVTKDPAMLVWLSGVDNRKGAINENYAREVMELFTLGADRGAYTEADVRELARALSGWRVDWVNGVGYQNFRWDSKRWDAGSKTVFGQTGAFGTDDAVRLVLEHPLHASFFVDKLWSYFVPVAPTDATRARLEQLYVASGRQIRPVVEAILTSPEFYGGPRMVKPAVVYSAGLMRARGQGITDGGPVWQGAMAGQQLYYPPDVSGWDDARWLDTSTMAGRWWLANSALAGGTFSGAAANAYSRTETADAALASALDFWTSPWLTAETRTAMRDWAAQIVPSKPYPYQVAQRQNALRMLVAMSPDYHTS